MKLSKEEISILSELLSKRKVPQEPTNQRHKRYSVEVKHNFHCKICDSRFSEMKKVDLLTAFNPDGWEQPVSLSGCSRCVDVISSRFQNDVRGAVEFLLHTLRRSRL